VITINTQKALAIAKAAKLAEINAACDQAISAIKSTYPEAEVLSWAKQEAEARALQGTASVDTPLLDAIASTRGITRTDLASRVMKKSNAFAALTGAVIGKRQELESAISAAETVEAVRAISW
jgi:hypothetical protein